MKNRKQVLAFSVVSVLLLLYMLWLGSRAGMNCDEVLHYNHSVDVLNFFATGGKDTAALHTPDTHLMYYGQSFDNITTLLIRAFDIEDIYTFRHMMSSLAGWLTAFVAALLAVWISGYPAGIIVLLLFAVSPTFLGHAQNNLKDTPFALAYIAGLFFLLKFLNSGKKVRWSDIALLAVSIAFSISIRPGGIILIALLWLFLGFSLLYTGLRETITVRQVIIRLGIAGAVSVTGYLLSTLMWPYALQDPIRHPIEAYRIMVHFPDTFRQIFEGRAEWSDYMPWYYLPKFMAITIPLIILTAFVLGPLFILSVKENEKRIPALYLYLAVLLPVLFVIVSDPNLYSAWRHFTFLYPPVVILAAITIKMILDSIETVRRRIFFLIILLLSVLDPLDFILSNPAYPYLYYNQLAGGLKGAFGNYETDYYYVSHRESSEWLLRYLKEKGKDDPIVVGTNFSAEWYFSKEPNVRNVYFRNEERSMNDWDYAITTCRYITPFQLKTGKWPPADALKVIYVRGVPISAVTGRKTKDDLLGFRAMREGRNMEAAGYFKSALKVNNSDEMIFYNFAVVLNRLGEKSEADSAIARCLEINPDFEPALMYLGNLSLKEGDYEKASAYYRRLLKINRKYYEAYDSLKKITH